MKNARFSLWLAAAFLAGGVASWLLTVPTARAENQSDWDYKCFRAPTTGTPETTLITLGGRGWELVTADNGIYCMKHSK